MYEDDDLTRDLDSPEGAEPALEPAEGEAPLGEVEGAPEGEPGGELEGDIPEEPTDNKERSRLGRKLSDLEQRYEDTNRTLARIEALIATQSSAIKADADPEYDPDALLTYADLEKLQQKKETETRRKQQVYESTYIASIGTQQSDIYSEVKNELLTNVAEYPTHTNFADPARDAAINFKLAEAAVIKRKYSTPESRANVRGGTPRQTGVTSGQRTSPPPAKTTKLDPVAEKFARAMGLDEEFVQKSVGKG